MLPTCQLRPYRCAGPWIMNIVPITYPSGEVLSVGKSSTRRANPCTGSGEMARNTRYPRGFGHRTRIGGVQVFSGGAEAATSSRGSEVRTDILVG